MLRDKIKPYIPQIVSREMTNRALAAELNVAEESISRILKQLKVIRDPAPNGAAKRELNKTRREFRIQAANTLPVKAAATAANCSTRTIYRLRKKNA